MSGLTARGVTVVRGAHPIVNGVDVGFTRGALTAIVGPNGAGKSTLVKALLGLIDAQGAVQLDGQDVAAMAPRVRARSLAYLPQGERHAWPLPVEAVVGLGRYPHGDKRRGDERNGDAGEDGGTVEDVLDRLDLTGLHHRSVLTLSGGEQMRTAVARALAVDADFVLADEPLASLDPRYQFQIMNALAGEAAAGKGVVIVLHDLALAARYAHHMVVMTNGAVAASGAPREVLTAARVEAGFGVRTAPAMVDGVDGPIEVALPIGLASA